MEQPEEQLVLHGLHEGDREWDPCDPDGYDNWAMRHGDVHDLLTELFAIGGVDEASQARVDRLMSTEPRGAKLHAAVARLVSKYPGVVGAEYEEPDSPVYDPAVDKDEIRRKGYNPTRRQDAREAYERFAELHGFRRPEWEAVQGQKASAAHASRPRPQGEEQERPVSSHRSGRSR